VLVDFDRTLENMDGEKLQRDAGKDKPPVDMTLGWLVSNALLTPPAQNPNDSQPRFEPADRKIALYELARMVYKGGCHDLTSDQIVLAKQKVNENFSAMIVGQALPMLEGKAINGSSEA
jgi:hypothetical protein